MLIITPKKHTCLIFDQFHATRSTPSIILAGIQSVKVDYQGQNSLSIQFG